MTITKTNRGYHSSLTGHTYEALQAAEHFENQERMIASNNAEADKLLDGLTTAQIKALATAMNLAVDNQRNSGVNRYQAESWLAANPHINLEGTDEGYRNGVALDLYLRQRGKRPPYSAVDLDGAASALDEMGMLYVDRKQQKQREIADVEENSIDGGIFRHRIKG